ncbi:glycosyl transferase family 1 [Alkalitalea saponilacus]|nr:glycosyl transferase family 1 [Alkalitalea saponilacus]
MVKLAIIASHPVQYNAPLFALLSKDVHLKVFYTWSQKEEDNYDADFKANIEWDIPLLEGYEFSFIENKAPRPGGHHFHGIICPSLIREIQNWEATHLLIFGWNYHAHLSAMRYFKNKVPVWFRGDSTLVDEKPGIKTFLRRRFLKWVYRHIDKALYVGSNNKAYFIKHGLKEEQLIFAPHAIDNHRFSDDYDPNYNTKAIEWRKKLGIKKTDKVIHFCGKFEDKKNPILLLNAFLDIIKQPDFSHLKLLLTGSGHLEDQLRSIAGKNPAVIFQPFQNQSVMPIIYRLGDIFCLPSQGPGETWGLVVNEAMAAGRPVVVSDKVGCAIDLVNKDTGKIFRSDSKRSLIESILYIITKLNSPSHYLSIDIKRHIELWSFDNIKKSILNNFDA